MTAQNSMAPNGVRSRRARFADSLLASVVRPPKSARSAEGRTRMAPQEMKTEVVFRRGVEEKGEQGGDNEDAVLRCEERLGRGSFIEPWIPD